MSDKTHRIVAAAGGVAFIVVAALLQAHLGAKADKAFEIVMSVLGALGFGVAKPVFAAAPAKIEEPTAQILKGEFGKEVK